MSDDSPHKYSQETVDELVAQRAKLEAELQAVMHSVDKWFDEIPNDNPATRAARAREIALQVIERVEVELREAVAILQRADEALSMAADLDDKTITNSERQWTIEQIRGAHRDITGALARHKETNDE
jgi:hypothetical protein